jgi:hypothetical protein
VTPGPNDPLDPRPVPDDVAGCTVEAVGSVGGVEREVVTCPLEDAAHELEASAPVGLVVYGYGPAGSYAYVGGTNLERINPLE